MRRTSLIGRPAASLGLTAALVLGVVSCAVGDARPDAATSGVPPRTSTDAGPGGSSAPASPNGSVTPDSADGLRGELLQFRRDVPARRLQVRLTADAAGLVVEAVALVAPGLSATAATDREAVLRPGAPMDLPLLLGASDCAVDPGPPTALVRLRDAAGVRSDATVPLDDGGLVQRLHEAECAEQELRDQAAIEVAEILAVETADGPALDVVVRLSRVSGSTPVRVTGLGSNTVYSITARGPLPTLAQQGSVELGLRLLPARCDVHALGESYRTGLIGLTLALGDEEARPFVLTPDDAARSRLETFAVETCRSRAD